MGLFADLKELPKLRQELADANTKLADLATLETTMAEAATENAKLISERDSLKASSDQLRQEYDDYKAKEGERNAAYAAANIAGNAIPPVTLKAKETESGKKNFSNLTGFERAKAAHMAQYTKN